MKNKNAALIVMGARSAATNMCILFNTKVLAKVTVMHWKSML